jgi:hypothetical protein
MIMQTKNIFLTILVLLFLLGGGPVQATSLKQSDGLTLTLDGPEQVPATALGIDVTLTVSDAVALAAFEADLGYDPALVAVSGITADGFLGDTSQGCDPAETRCEAALGPLAQGADVSAIGGYAFGTGTAHDGNGTLAVVHLTPTGATGVLTLTLTNPLAADADATPITPTVQGTVIRITAAEVCTSVTGVALSTVTTGTLRPNEPVTFAADLTPDDASQPYTYTLDYGDGNAPITTTASTDPLTFTHTYVMSDTYTVEIGVWNCDIPTPITDTLDVEIIRAADAYIYLPIVIKNIDRLK